MAKFSEQFIAGLLQPNFSEGMFNLGTAIGSAPALYKKKKEKERILEAFSTGKPVDRFNLAIKQHLESGEYDKAATMTAKREDFIAKQQVKTDKALIQAVASSMISSNAAEVPTTFTDSKGNSIDIHPRLNSEILDAANTLLNRQEARELAVKAGVLAPKYIKIIENNPSILENNPILKATYEKVTDPKATMMRSQRVKGVQSIIESVNSFIDNKKSLMEGPKAAEVRVNRLIDRIKKAGSNMWMWQDDDMADALEDMSDAELKLFREQAALLIQQKPNATDQQIIDYGMSGMREKIPGQEQSAAISAEEAQIAAANRAIVEKLMELENLTEEEAIERLKADQRAATLFNVGKTLATNPPPIN